MCNFKSWYFDDNGYVIECMDCNHLRICFGSILLTLGKKEYLNFYNQVLYKKETQLAMHNADIKCIVLATRSKSVQMLLTEKELHDLYTMLQLADIEMITQQLLDLFGKGNA